MAYLPYPAVSFLCKISLVMTGLACPLESFIHLPLQKIQRRGITRLEVGHRFRIRRDHLIHQRLQRARVAELLHPLFLDDHRRRSAGGKHLHEHFLSLLATDFARVDQID